MAAVPRSPGDAGFPRSGHVDAQADPSPTRASAAPVVPLDEEVRLEPFPEAVAATCSHGATATQGERPSPSFSSSGKAGGPIEGFTAYNFDQPGEQPPMRFRECHPQTDLGEKL